MVLHPRDPDKAWVFPMDGTDVWPRTSPGGRPAVYGTRDAGASWQRLDRGLRLLLAQPELPRQRLQLHRPRQRGLQIHPQRDHAVIGHQAGGQWGHQP